MMSASRTVGLFHFHRLISIAQLFRRGCELCLKMYNFSCVGPGLFVSIAWITCLIVLTFNGVDKKDRHKDGHASGWNDKCTLFQELGSQYGFVNTNLNHRSFYCTIKHF